nr:hypothetical protein [Desulfuromonadales bacterium]
MDLSQAWFEQTGKTFVHAVVASREGVRPDPKTLALLNRAGEDGLAQMDLIVKDFIKTTGLDAAVCEDYLRHRIRF